MPNDLNFSGLFSLNKKNRPETMMVNLGIITFEDGKSTVVYAPALEVYGYGNDLEEAKLSFETGLLEFIDYTTAKSTFDSELERLGWKLKGSKKNRKFKVPDFAYLLSNNERLIDIMNTRSVRTFQTDIPLALA